MASSHYFYDQIDQEFASLKTYNDENVEREANRKKSQHIIKMSHTSDEIQKVVNEFFEKNNTILEVVPLATSKSFL